MSPIGRNSALALGVLAVLVCAGATIPAPGIDLAGIDRSVLPGDDFFAYANGNWYKSTPIPPDRAAYGSGAIVYDRTSQRTVELIQEAARENATASGPQRQVGDYYASFMDEAAIEAQGARPLASEQERIEKVRIGVFADSVCALVYVAQQEGFFKRHGLDVTIENYQAGAYAVNGVPLMVGTDLILPGILPGFSVHEEMAIWQEAGIPPADILRSATLIPAQFMGKADRLGSIGAGKTASVVLVRANPLEDIRNAQLIESVFLRGEYFSRQDLDRLLLEAKQLAQQPAFRFRIICAESFLKSASGNDLVDAPVAVVVLVNAGESSAHVLPPFSVGCPSPRVLYSSKTRSRSTRSKITPVPIRAPARLGRIRSSKKRPLTPR